MLGTFLSIWACWPAAATSSDINWASLLRLLSPELVLARRNVVWRRPRSSILRAAPSCNRTRRPFLGSRRRRQFRDVNLVVVVVVPVVSSNRTLLTLTFGPNLNAIPVSSFDPFQSQESQQIIGSEISPPHNNLRTCDSFPTKKADYSLFSTELDSSRQARVESRATDCAHQFDQFANQMPQRSTLTRAQNSCPQLRASQKQSKPKQTRRPDV